MIASGASSPRRLKVGALRDTVLEAEVVTGDGRLVRSGARTVKNVTGYDLHKLVAGSLGTLAVIVQVALKLRPLPRARRTLRFDGDLELADELVGAVHGSAAVLATPGAVDVRLEGWPEEVEEQTAMARQVQRPVATEDDEPFPLERPWEGFPVVAEAAVPPSKLGEALTGDGWGALAGVGIAWMGLDETHDGALDELREPRPRGRRDRARRSRSRRARPVAGPRSGRAAPAQGCVRPERRARPGPRMGQPLARFTKVR